MKEKLKKQEISENREKVFEIDLRKADLKGVERRGFDWRNYNLEEADLRGADLRNAALTSSNLNSAKLQLANLNKANLENATLDNAILQAADLIEANLKHASLVNTNLRATNLKNADMENADLQGCELSFSGYFGPEYAANLYRTKFSKDLVSSNFCHSENKGYEEEERKFCIERLENAIFRSYSANLGTTLKAVFALAAMRLEKDPNFCPLDWGREHERFEKIFKEKQMMLQNKSVSDAIQKIQDKITTITGKSEGSYEAQRVASSNWREKFFKTMFKKDSRNRSVEWLRRLNKPDLRTDTRALSSLLVGLLDIKSLIEAEDNIFPSKLLEQVNDVLQECSNVAKKPGEQPVL